MLHYRCQLNSQRCLLCTCIQMGHFQTLRYARCDCPIQLAMNNMGSDGIRLCWHSMDDYTVNELSTPNSKYLSDVVLRCSCTYAHVRTQGSYRLSAAAKIAFCRLKQPGLMLPSTVSIYQSTVGLLVCTCMYLLPLLKLPLFKESRAPRGIACHKHFHGGIESHLWCSHAIAS